MECSKLIIQAGIKRVVYFDPYQQEGVEAVKAGRDRTCSNQENNLVMRFRIKQSSAYLPLIFAIVLIVGMLIGVKLVDHSGERSMFVYPKTDKLSGVLNFIEMEYVDSVSKIALLRKPYLIILKNLDPHSSLYTCKDVQRSPNHLEGTLKV
jgi:hypothetical protein